MVVDAILGVVKLDPVPKLDPPLEAENQLSVPALPLAAKSTVPVPHLEPGVVEEIVGADTYEIVALPCVLQQPAADRALK